MKKKLLMVPLLFLTAIVFGTNLNAQTYCDPEGTNASRHITNFTTNGGVLNITNSGSGFSTDGHGLFLSEVVSQLKGDDVSFSSSIVGGTSGFRIWVDWDQDGVFDTSSELAYNSTSYSASHTGSFTVPMTATEGPTRMRIVSHYLSSSGDVDPCETGFTYGEFEDYTFDVLPAPSCPKPTDLLSSMPTPTSVEVAWTAGGGENDWNISWGPVGYTPGDTDEIATDVSTTPNFQITGLTDNTEYDVYVQADCGNGDESVWSDYLTVRTSCIETTLPYLLDFESVTTPGLPLCTSLENTGIGTDWRTRASATGFTGKVLNYSYHSSSNPGAANSWFYTQGIELEAGVDYQISYKYGNGSTTYDESMKVAFGTSADESAMTNQLADYPAISTSTPIEELVNFTVPADGIYYFGFNAYSIENQNQLYVDDIFIDATPTCIQPEDLVVTNIITTSATLGWTEMNSATSWNIEYGAPGFVLGSSDGTTITGASNPETITITPNTEYEFYVQSDCGGGDESYWVGPFAFSNTYCTPVHTSTSDYLKSIVSLGAVTEINYTASSQPTDGYADETAQTFESYETQTFLINTDYQGGANGVYVWVDWNNDFVFDPTTELVASETTGVGNTRSLTVTVPAGTALGDYRMRVRAKYGSSAVVGPCGSTSYGSAVDFTLSIGAAPACLVPGDLTATNITSTSVDLGWTENGTATTWNIEYGPAGYTPGSGTTENGVTNPFNLNGIPSSTDYDFYVQSDCGGTLSNWSIASSFMTDCAIYMAPFYEGFNNGVQPNCWENLSSNTTSTSANNLWLFNDQGDYESQNNGKAAGTFTKSDGSTPTPDSMMLITPLIDLTPLTSPELSFEWYSNNTDNPGDNVPLIVEIHDGTSWTLLDTLKGDDPNWLEVYYDLSAYAGNTVQIRFMTNQTLTTSSAYYNDILLDEVRIDEVTTCYKPTALTASNITSTSAELGWTENNSASSWNVEFGPAGFTQGNGTMESAVGSNPHTVTLTPFAKYEFYVQSICGAGDESFWEGPFAFTNDYCEFTITSSSPQYIESFETTGADVDISNLNSGVGTNYPGYSDFTSMVMDAYETQVIDFTITASNTSTYGVSIFVDFDNDLLFDTSEKVFGTTSYTSMPFTGSITVPSGAVIGEYRMRVVIDYSNSTPGACSGSSAEAEDYTLNIVAPPSCISPSVLAVTNASSTSIELGWTENSGAVVWNVEYGPAGFTPGSGTTETGVSTNPFTINGLNPETDYDFYVQSDCSGGGLSLWSSVLTGTTLCSSTTVPYLQDFEGVTVPDLPSCSSLENTGIGNDWKTKIAPTGFTGNVLNYSYHSSSNPGVANSWFYTQGIELEAGETYFISYKYGNNSTTWAESMKVAYGTSPVESAMTNQLADHPVIELSTPDDEMIAFTVTADDVYYFGFNAYSIENQNQLYVDDIVVDLVPACTDVTALTATNITGSSADLGWTENGTATEWNIEYGTTGFTQGGGTMENGVTTNPYTLTGLTGLTDYDFYIQSDCGLNQGAWVGPFTFATLCTPSTSTDVQVACDSFTWIDGVDYTASNTTATHTIVGGDVNGCDSIVTLDLTINNSVTGIDTQTACESYEWIDGVVYTADNNSATHTIAGGAANGCDSIVTLNLTIDAANDAGNDVAITVCMNQPVKLDSLLSSGADAGGSWLDPADSPLVNTEIVLSDQPGTYDYSYVAESGSCPAATAVISITVDPGCDYLSVETEALIDISVYPNPATSVLTILNPSNTSSLKVEMLDMNGRVVLVEHKALNNATTATLAIENLERGIYTLRIYNDEAQKTFKIVKQ